MKIDPTSTPTTTQAASGGALKGSKDEFLKLFMAQLQHQDPLDPKNGADMVAQLAQFSSVEQATQTNSHLADLASAQAATSSASLANLVGRSCNAAAGDFQLERGGAIPPLQVTSTAAMTGASAVITDETGKEVRRIAIPTGTSSTQLAWDGNNAEGAPVPSGSYHIAIEPGTTTGTIASQWRARVDAVELAGGTTRLRMGGVLIAPGDIQTIGLSTPSTPSIPSTPPSATSVTQRLSSPGAKQ
jgi:flagellar basal-body rod modification protein FlgD